MQRREVVMKPLENSLKSKTQRKASCRSSPVEASRPRKGKSVMPACSVLESLAYVLCLDDLAMEPHASQVYLHTPKKYKDPVSRKLLHVSVYARIPPSPAALQKLVTAVADGLAHFVYDIPDPNVDILNIRSGSDSSSYAPFVPFLDAWLSHASRTSRYCCPVCEYSVRVCEDTHGCRQAEQHLTRDLMIINDRPDTSHSWKKWSKGKSKDKLNNMVLFDEATYKKLLQEIPKARLITPSIVCERLKVNASLARQAIRFLCQNGYIKQVGEHHHAQYIYTRNPVAASSAAEREGAEQPQ
ncbi:UNVERIFIED_CONTAM: hypothetical protein H355_011103 [Colinus virginianus]|nr:hypothetical protein H355_011103 [Colinus virginianus]